MESDDLSPECSKGRPVRQYSRAALIEVRQEKGHTMSDILYKHVCDIGIGLLSDGNSDVMYPQRSATENTAIFCGRKPREDKSVEFTGDSYAEKQTRRSFAITDLYKDKEDMEMQGPDRGRGGYRGRTATGYYERGHDRGRGGYRERTASEYSERGGRPRFTPMGSRNTFDLDFFKDLTDPDDATLKLSRQTDGLKVLLESPAMSTKHSLKLLKLLLQVSSSELHRESALKIFQAVCCSGFLDLHLPAVIKLLQTYNSRVRADSGTVNNTGDSTRTEAKESEKVEMKTFDTIQTMLKIVSEICTRLPSFASKGSLLLAYLDSAHSVMAVVRAVNPGLEQVIKDLKEVCEERTNMVQSAGRSRDNYRRRAVRNNEEGDIPPEDFVSLPIFPQRSDMDWTEKPFLRANKKHGAFKDQDHYLDVQFRLLREDYIRPLRNGIKEYKQMREKGEAPKKCQDLRFYYRVKITQILCKETLQHQLQFDNKRLKFVKWATSKRLQFGSLVCLSMDDFETVYFAVVTKREVADLKYGFLQVQFENCLEDVLEASPDDLFTMAETTAYFEASRHVLEGLQEMKTNVPMMRYIVECHSDVKPPKYLLDTSGTKTMDLSTLLKNGSQFDASAVSVIMPRSWPSLEETGFNESQLEAVRTALTKELALIKGPPGTGKTYVGLKITEALLANRHVWNKEDESRPILVVCYTNHALDQFLEGMLEFCPEGIIRVGSRCKNPKLEAFNLTEMRRSLGDRDTDNDLEVCLRERNDCFRLLKRLGPYVELKSLLIDALPRKCVLRESILKDSVPECQYLSLRKHISMYTYSTDPSVIFQWLTLGSAILTHTKESDPYTLLAQEVTSLILHGRDSQAGPVIKPANVNTVTTKERAQRYRFWLKKVVKPQQPKGPGTKEDLQASIKKSTTEIVCDTDLKSAMGPGELSAIKDAVLKSLEKENDYCIRAWLGVDKSSADIMSQLLKDTDEMIDESDVTPETVMLISRKTRARLYRLWLRKAEEYYSARVSENKRKKRRFKRRLLKAKEQLQEILVPDDVLKPAIKADLYTSIREAMLKKLDLQSQFCVQTWLGIREFCRDPHELEKVYKELLETSQNPAVAAPKEKDEPAKMQEESEMPDQDEENDERLLEDDVEDASAFRDELPTNMAGVTELLWADSRYSVFQEMGEESPMVFQDTDKWSVPACLQKILMKRVMQMLQRAVPMTAEEASAVEDVWDQDLKMVDRVRLYLHWVQVYLPKLKEELQKETEQFAQESRQYQELKMAVDCKILQQAKVIGMTTTGAARYRKVLSKVGCPIVIIEEAAEVLEAHVVTTLNQSCQHLILIGDHQQLRPSPTVYDLCRHYQLDLSLFERLVNNNVAHSTLGVQHRMRPEVARLVRHVYPDLMDHTSTVDRPHIQGMKENVFFFHHETAETTHDETNSKSNIHEAQLCVGLCVYLLNQGYSAQSITVLTAYTGQVLLLKSSMPVKGVRVSSVDNYQGEENDVIILSLVRSNEEGTVGFLGTDNRVCVAISRAKCGFYAFGNFRILAEKSRLWKKIVDTARENGQIGDKLVLQCVNHPDTQLLVSCAEDFKKAPQGGCQLPCETRLPCGHQCNLPCHGYDLNHREYQCKEKCERQVCKQNLHPCSKLCYQDCGTCNAIVQKIVPSCGHTQAMPCAADPSKSFCSLKCEEILSCDHRCNQKCGECQEKGRHTEQCLVTVVRTLPCKHRVKVECFSEPKNIICRIPCTVTLDCGHKCPGNCSDCMGGRVHEPCTTMCEQILKGCGHKVSLLCGATCPPCNKTCETPCKHGNCYHDCNEPCWPCTDSCPWACGHKECGRTCDDPCQPCDFKCQEKLSCGHLCMGNCGEKCFCFHCEKDKIIPLETGANLSSSQENWEQRSVQSVTGGFVEDDPTVSRQPSMMKLPGCGHIFCTEALDTYIQQKLKNPLCHENLTCPACPALLKEYHCWRYNHLLRQRYTAQQAAKQMAGVCSVSDDRQLLIERSINIAKRYFRFPTMDVCSVNVSVDAAFVLTNQCKLVLVANRIEDLLTHFDNSDNKQWLALKHAVSFKVKRLLAMILRPLKVLPTQRCQELTEETRRLTYIALLVCARTLLQDDEESIGMVDSCLQELRGKSMPAMPTAEMEKIFDRCRQRSSDWNDGIAKSLNLEILDAPYVKDLCCFDVSTTLKGAILRRLTGCRSTREINTSEINTREINPQFVNEFAADLEFESNCEVVKPETQRFKVKPLTAGTDHSFSYRGELGRGRGGFRSSKFLASFQQSSPSMDFCLRDRGYRKPREGGIREYRKLGGIDKKSDVGVGADPSFQFRGGFGRGRGGGGGRFGAPPPATH